MLDMFSDFKDHKLFINGLFMRKCKFWYRSF